MHGGKNPHQHRNRYAREHGFLTKGVQPGEDEREA